ncbi:MAG: hypothetical protein IJK81_00370 [Selenomonadaceae bacterium]|nr:hypothetical protein [Selenomonadaceae bacterium]
MFTFDETRKLIDMALEKPEFVKDAMEYVKDFIDEFEEVYDDNKPKGLKNEEQREFYKKLISAYLREKNFDIG